MTGHLLSAPVIGGASMLWYTTRATGIVALVLLTATVVLGVIGTARAASPRWPRLVTAALHRNLALTSIALVAVHVVTTVVDPFTSIGVTAAFIPFSSNYRPLWLSLGTVAFDLLLAVLITSLLRDRLKHRTWQIVHLLVYASWPVALWHGLGTGTDSRLTWVLGIDVLCVTAVGWAVWWRLSFTEDPRTRATGWLGLAAIPVLTAAFVLLGPLQPGWARRAGTPASLLGARKGTQAQGQPGSGTASAGQLVNARFSGTLSTSNGPGEGERTITITGHTLTGTAEPVVIQLHGTPSGGGVALTDGNVQIGRRGSASAYSGPVVQLAGQQLVAIVSGSSGQRRAQFVLSISGSAVTGTVSLLNGGGQ